MSLTTVLIGAFAIGFVAGLRTFTAPAALAIWRGGPILAVVLSLLAVGELVMDALPSTPSRTALRGLALRIVSGAACGWIVASVLGGPPFAGAVAGVLGALAGTYGGHASRLRAIVAIGPIPAALLEDAVAIGLAAILVVRGFA